MLGRRNLLSHRPIKGVMQLAQEIFEQPVAGRPQLQAKYIRMG